MHSAFVNILIITTTICEIVHHSCPFNSPRSSFIRAFEYLNPNALYIRQNFYIYSVSLYRRTRARGKKGGKNSSFVSCKQCVCGGGFVSRDKRREHSGKLSLTVINSWRDATFNCNNYDNYWRAHSAPRGPTSFVGVATHETR